MKGSTLSHNDFSNSFGGKRLSKVVFRLKFFIGYVEIIWNYFWTFFYVLFNKELTTA